MLDLLKVRAITQHLFDLEHYQLVSIKAVLN